jgi:hypothetical protein
MIRLVDAHWIATIRKTRNEFYWEASTRGTIGIHGDAVFTSKVFKTNKECVEDWNDFAYKNAFKGVVKYEK